MLKRLELQGFKSFAEKTVLEFPPGITAIVGPNGSGKSNVVDAIRWVLGEQSLKNMRLAKTEDVIFSGTPGHPPAGFAAVTVVLENSKKIFPEERPEIAIGRKLYRDGQSIYLLHQQEVRLKDITRLMAAGKLGTKGLAVISQGAGDAFLSASPAERREMLEEAIGLKEYRLKKEEAARKMDETISNLDKVASLLQELSPHLKSLQRQVARWEKRKEKAEELHSLQEKYFHWKLHQIEESALLIAERKKVMEEVAALEEEIKKLEALQRSAEDSLSHFKGQDAKLHQALQKTIKEREELSRLLGNIEGKIEALSHGDTRVYPNPETLLALLKKIKSEISAILESENWQYARSTLKKLLEEIEKVLETSAENLATASKENLDKEKEALLAKLNVLELEVKRLMAEAEEERLKRERAYEDVEKILRELAEKRKALGAKTSLLQEYRLEDEKRRLQEEDLAAKLREAGWDYQEFRATHINLPPPAIESPTMLETRIMRLERELADIGLVDEELVEEYQNTESRYSFLTSQKSDLEAAIYDLKMLQKELEKKINQEFSTALKRINNEFQHYFRLIFGGGRARLKEDIGPEKELNQDEKEVNGLETAESGIEIYVELPRKKVKSLDMLSGGERALTAIALIFAVVGVSSPPFLVLDEIDAPLDEANSERFGRLLKELASKTQFILITHNRVTMEAADVLYGVTMQDGISKIFSLKFQEAQELASKDVHVAA